MTITNTGIVTTIGTGEKCAGCVYLNPVTHHIMTSYGTLPVCTPCAEEYASFMAVGFPKQGGAAKEPDSFFTVSAEAHGMRREFDATSLKEALELMVDPMDLADKCTVPGSHTIELWMTMRIGIVGLTVKTRLL
jgi:hypothetical protein